MTDKPSKNGTDAGVPASSKTHAEQRAERLNAALRDNLRRRKAAQNETPDTPAADHEKTSENGGENP